MVNNQVTKVKSAVYPRMEYYLQIKYPKGHQKSWNRGVSLNFVDVRYSVMQAALHGQCKRLAENADERFSGSASRSYFPGLPGIAIRFLRCLLRFLPLMAQTCFNMELPFLFLRRSLSAVLKDLLLMRRCQAMGVSEALEHWWSARLWKYGTG